MEGRGATAPKSCPTPKPVSLPKAQAERSFHVFYELLAGLDAEDREKLSLQGPEAYYYLNQVGPRLSWMCAKGSQDAVGIPGAALPQACCVLQGRACRLQDKEDAQDFKGLVKALRVLGLCAEELTEVWAVLATILHLGNICFSSSEVGSPVMGPVSTQDGQWWAVCAIRAVMMPSHCVWKIIELWAASGSRQIPMVQTRK